MREPLEHLVLPLDVDKGDIALDIVKRLKDLVGVFKVGLELFVSEGPTIIRRIKEISCKKIFLDLKLNDIPETVSKALRACTKWDVDFVTVHPDECFEALKRFPKDERGGLKILGVTVLTSLNENKLLKLGYASDLSYNIKELVGIRAELMVEAGVEGLVCSGKEISLLRHRFPQILLFVPGIRPLWSLVEGEDQSRVITPKDAMIQGSDYLVIGRPILKSPDPKEAAIKIIKEIEEGLSWRSKISTT